MDKPTLSYSDLKKIYGTTKTTPDRKTALCYSGTKVNIRSLKVKDKKNFLKAMESKDDEIIEGCIDSIIEQYVCDSSTGDQIDPNNLLEQERQQLMAEIRMASSNTEGIKLAHRCPKCKERHEDIIFNSSNIKTDAFKMPDNVSDVIEVAGKRVIIRLGHLTRKDNIDIAAYIKDKKVESATDKQYIFLAVAIKEIKINDDDIAIPVQMKINEKIEFLENMSILDYDKIESFFDSIDDFGVKLQFPFKCSKCGYESPIEEIKVVSFFMS